MTNQTPAAEDAQHETRVDSDKPRLVVVELAKRRPPDQVRRLRKGRGKLVGDIESVLDELVSSGTIDAGAQPVVIVVREAGMMPLLDIDDEDDEDDEDED